MKLHQLFESANLSSDDLAYDWLIKDGLLHCSEEEARKLLKIYDDSPVKGKAFLDNLQSDTKIAIKLKNANLYMYKIENGMLTIPNPTSLVHSFAIWETYDLLGAPTFKFANDPKLKVEIAKTKKFTALETWLPEVCKGIKFTKCENLKSLKNIHKFVKQCRFIDLQDTKIESNLLGVYQIKGMDHISTNEINTDLSKACEIITDCLRSNKDVFECQEELIEAGFKELAKL